MTIRAAVLLSLLVLSGCVQVTPRARTGDSGLPIGQPNGGWAIPDARPSPDREPPAAEVTTVCRSRGAPRGWIATGYLRGGADCPPVEEGNPYTRARVERYANRPVGWAMIVCADQPVPSGWFREARGEGDCIGARVGAGHATAHRIRRTR